MYGSPSGVAALVGWAWEMRIDSILLKVGDSASLHAMRSWYVRHLGAEVNAEDERFVCLGSSSPFLMLHVGEPLEDPARVSIYVEVSDLESVYASLVRSLEQIVVEPVFKERGVRVLAVADPVGHTVKPFENVRRQPLPELRSSHP